MLLDFINKFNVLQQDFPYYFQSIEGLAELIKTDSTKGQRIANNTKITITCLEGLDLRISYLLNLYRKIAWDDVYQRWVLPDMMRYFTLKIFISEFRTFHLPQNSDIVHKTAKGDTEIPVDLLHAITITPNTNVEFNARARSFGIPGIIGPPPPPPASTKPSGLESPLFLTILDDILPTWEINCEMCEFDIHGIGFEYLNKMHISDTTQATVKFSIIVGNIKELQIYPAFAHTYLSDRKLNGLNRTKEEISTMRDSINKYAYPVSLHIAQNRDGPTSENYHVSGTPYGEFQNNPNILNAYNQPKQASGDLTKDLLGGITGNEVIKVVPTQPETWVGNAVTWGIGFAKNAINKVIDKAKTTPIPQLGVSFTEIKVALQSKNIIAALGMIRKGVNEVVQSYGNAPSSLLEQPIQTDNIMKSFLTTLTLSEATDEDTLTLKGAANMALNDAGTWQQIKDYSMATNLVGIGIGEVNTEKVIKDSTAYSSVAQVESNLASLTIPPSGIINPVPNAASGNIVYIPSEIIPPSNLLSGSIIDGMNDIAPSQFLGTTTQGSGITNVLPSSQLRSNTGNEPITQVLPSSQLGNETTDETHINRGKPSQQLGKVTIGTEKTEKEIPSSHLGTTTISTDINTSTPSSKLSSKIQIENLQKEKPNVRTTTLDTKNIIEFSPTSILYKNIDAEQLNQPPPSKATNSNLE